ncbi:hypothetical protein FHS61_002372 [Altererythrobacter atlanticus]|nr:hypothetical protein [Croceibacterium atlanticum]
MKTKIAHQLRAGDSAAVDPVISFPSPPGIRPETAARGKRRAVLTLLKDFALPAEHVSLDKWRQS